MWWQTAARISSREFRQQGLRKVKDSFLLVGRGELPEEVAFELHLEGLRLLGAGESAGIRRCRVVIESRSGGIRVTGFPMLAQL